MLTVSKRHATRNCNFIRGSVVLPCRTSPRPIGQGLAYEPGADFIRYTDGTVNHWNKLERPGILIENGHVTAVTLAVIDGFKEEENGNDGHGSKIIVILFDGAALDRDLANADQAH